MDIQEYVQAIARRAKEASHALAALSTEEKNAMLEKAACALEAGRGKIAEANAAMASVSLAM